VMHLYLEDSHFEDFKLYTPKLIPKRFNMGVGGYTY
jgi:hypothetical protein